MVPKALCNWRRQGVDVKQYIGSKEKLEKKEKKNNGIRNLSFLFNSLDILIKKLRHLKTSDGLT